MQGPVDRRYDLILDVKTNRPLSHYLHVLDPRGAYITKLFEDGKLKSVITVAEDPATGGRRSGGGS